MDNGAFVENMLYRIRDYADNGHVHTESIIVSLRDYYKYDKDKAQLTYKISQRLIDQIELRVKDLLYVLDPMWFVVALYHRNKGGLWRDMHKYGVKPDKCTWTIDPCTNYSRGGQTGFCEKHYKIWVLWPIDSSYKVEKPSNGEPVVYTQKLDSDRLPTL